MADLTVVVITKNEEKNIRKCIESFRGIAKRFVVVDSGSTDETKSICDSINKELKDIGASLDFYFHEFTSHANQLNWAFSNTSIDTEWTMRIDADEELMESLADEIQEKLCKIEPSINGIVVRRRTIFMGRWIKHGGRYPEYLLRIFRTGKASCEMKIMDEHIVLSEGGIVTFKHDLIDNNQKSLDWWTTKHNWYSNKEVMDHQMSLSGQSFVEAGGSSNQAKIKRIVKDGGYYKLPMFFRAHLYYIYRYYFKLGFLDGPEGRIFHFLQAYWYRFLVDAKLFECKKNNIEIKEQRDLQA